MSQLFMATVVAAGSEQSVKQFDELLEREGAMSSVQGFRRRVLSPGVRGHSSVVEYAARTSRCRPILWEVVSSHALVALDLLTLQRLFEEQGNGSVFVEHGTVPLFSSPSVYGYCDEGQNEVRKAEMLFVQVASERFGVDAATKLAVEEGHDR